MKALILEEYKLTRIALVKMLEYCFGFSEVYSNDEIKMDEIEAKNPELIFLDIDIAQKNLNFAKNIKSIFPEIKIIILVQKEDLKHELTKNPYIDYSLEKDVEEEKLKKVINCLFQENLDTEIEREEILNINSNAPDVFDVA